MIQTPKTSEIQKVIIGQMESSLNQTIPLLPKAFNRVIAKALAGLIIILYKYAGSIFLNLFISTASINNTEINGKILVPLGEWGDLIGIGPPTAATQAELSVVITVLTQTGTISSNEQLVNDDNGVTYLTIGDVALDAPTVLVTIRASSDQTGGRGAGVIGNLDVGSVVSFVRPLANVIRDTTVDSQIVTGADMEDIGVYRQRIKDRFQRAPQGGASADYEQWGEETAGIINVYPYTGDPGQIDLYSEATVASSGDPDGIPTSAQLIAVKETVELNVAGLATRRPVNAFINSNPITRKTFDVTVVSLVGDNPTEVKAAISTALTNYFLTREPYVVGLTLGVRQDRITSAAVSGTVEDITAAADNVFERIILESVAVDIIIYALLTGEKAKLGVVSYI